MKQCSRCREMKLEEEFYLVKGKPMARCARCVSDGVMIAYLRRTADKPRRASAVAKFEQLLDRDEQLRALPPRDPTPRFEDAAFALRERLSKRGSSRKIVLDEDKRLLIDDQEQSGLMWLYTGSDYKSNPNWLCWNGRRRFPSIALEEEIKAFYDEWVLEGVLDLEGPNEAVLRE